MTRFRPANRRAECHSVTYASGLHFQRMRILNVCYEKSRLNTVTHLKMRFASDILAVKPLPNRRIQSALQKDDDRSPTPHRALCTKMQAINCASLMY